jgi:hypothetical protein
LPPGKAGIRIWAQAAADPCLFPGSKLPDLASSPPPQSGNELLHSNARSTEWPEALRRLIKLTAKGQTDLETGSGERSLTLFS